MSKTFVFDIPLLRTPLMVHFGSQKSYIKEVKKRLPKKEMKRWDTCFVDKPINGMCEEFDDGKFAIFFPFKYDGSGHQIGVIAHESLHVAKRACKYVEMKPCEETLCRIQQFIIQTIIECYTN